MQNQENTQASELKRPPDKICKCGVVTEPWLRPEMLGVPAKYWEAPDLCPECVEKGESIAKREKERQETQARLKQAFQSSMISPRFQDRTFSNYQLEFGAKEAYRAAHEFRVTDQGNGLLLYGDVGIGKTHLAAAIAHRYLGKETVLYISCPEFLDELRGKDVSPERMELAKRVKLLVLDDIGVEKPSEWVRERLYILINHRYEHKLPTVMTSNCTLDEIGEKLGDRIASRIVEMCKCVEIKGDDWRLKHGCSHKL